MSEYRSIYRLMLDTEEWLALPQEGRTTFLYLKLLLGMSGIDKLYPGTIEHVSGQTAEEVAVGMRALEDEKWIMCEPPIVWIRNGLRYEPSLSMENVKHRQGVLRHLRDLPRRQIIDSYCEYYGLENPWVVVADAAAEDSEDEAVEVEAEAVEVERVGKPITPDDRPTWYAGAVKWGFHAFKMEALKMWNEMLVPHGIAVVRTISSNREKHLKARFAERAFVDHYPEMLELASTSDLLRGKKGTGWKIDFDWLIKNDSNYIKVIEGRYNDGERRNGGTTRIDAAQRRAQRFGTKAVGPAGVVQGADREVSGVPGPPASEQ